MEIFSIFITYIAWSGGGKRRPALVFKKEPGCFIVFPITTKYNTKSRMIRSNYFKINDWAKSGLDKPSYIDVGSPRRAKESTCSGDPVVGKLTESDRKRLLIFLKNQQN